jgi:hypothetical protein
LWAVASKNEIAADDIRRLAYEHFPIVPQTAE